MLGRAGDEHQSGRTGGQRLLSRILDERLIDDGHHFLGAGLGRGQEPRTATGHWKHGRTNLELGHAQASLRYERPL